MPKKSRPAEFVRWLGQLLTALRDLGGSASPRQALDRIAEIEKVPDELRNTLHKSGQERSYNQVHWARQYLVWEGLIESGPRGVWSLTPAGRDRTLTAEQAREILLRQVQRQARNRKSAEAGGGQPEVDAGITSDTPQADQDSSLQRFLEVVKGMGSTGFERLCMRLLREAGFERVQVTGRSNDGCIDGVGVLQASDLMSFNVVFQCKKWGQAIPPKEMRDLRGAMDGRADKGIFLTTSTFSTSARAEAERPGTVPIEWVDGEKLFEMFNKYGAGSDAARGLRHRPAVLRPVRLVRKREAGPQVGGARRMINITDTYHGRSSDEDDPYRRSRQSVHDRAQSSRTPAEELPVRDR